MSSFSFGSSNRGNQVGINYGVVHLSPDQQKISPTIRPKPQPCSTVPFQRDPMFVGREAVIGAIKDKHGTIGQSHERVALVGLAGVGKTQTAIEYSYRVRESMSDSDTWVFWIHASNRARLEQGFQDIAAVAEISGRDDPQTDLLQLVSRWLRDARNGRWFMVLDNADDDSIFFRTSNASDERGPLERFLPQVAHGSILITSRNILAARNLVGRGGHVIQVQPMNEAESLALLRARLPAPESRDPEEDDSREDEKALVKELEYIPLAITQAGSYIANRLPLITVATYLRILSESESKRTRLLKNEDSTDLRRDPSIHYTVIRTWQISFEQIRQDWPAATDLLALMSMFDRQGIPEELVRNPGQDELDFYDTLAPLINYSLIRMEMSQRLFEMHSLVQLSVRAWLDMHQQLRSWQIKSLRIIERVFRDGGHESWTLCRSLLAHAKSVLKPIRDEDAHGIGDYDRAITANILGDFGWYLDLQGSSEEAEAMHRRALYLRETIHENEHPDVLACVSKLALVLSSQRKYEEAEAMYRRVLEGNKKALGNEHPNTLASLSNLGSVLHMKGKNREAEAIHRRALEGAKKALGNEHPYTLASLTNLGSVLQKKGKSREAEALYRCALEAQERVLGYKHPHTLATVSRLGSVLDDQRKYEEAEAMNRRELEGNGEVHGREHPYTILSANKLGTLLFNQGKYEEAEAMYRRDLEGSKKVFGIEHSKTLISLDNLGNALYKQGKYEEAEAIFRRDLQGSEKLLGKEHSDTLMCLRNLVNVLSKQGKYEEAEAIFRRVVEARKKVLLYEQPANL